MSEPFPSPKLSPREREARALLRRVRQEDGPQVRAAGEELDWAERWGRLIGRLLSWAITAAIVVWLALYVFGG